MPCLPVKLPLPHLLHPCFSQCFKAEPKATSQQDMSRCLLKRAQPSPQPSQNLGPGISPFMPAAPALHSAGAQWNLSAEGHAQTQAGIVKTGSAALSACSPQSGADLMAELVFCASSSSSSSYSSSSSEYCWGGRTATRLRPTPAARSSSSWSRDPGRPWGQHRLGTARTASQKANTALQVLQNPPSRPAHAGLLRETSAFICQQNPTHRLVPRNIT